MGKGRKQLRGAPDDQSPNSRAAILSAALQAFARYGYDGASLPKIARIADVAGPLIHYYFGSKEQLWRETVDFSLGSLVREADTIVGATRSIRPIRIQNGIPTLGDPLTTQTRDLQIGRLLFGVSYRVNQSTTINWTVELGATDDATDLRTSLRIPISLD